MSQFNELLAQLEAAQEEQSTLAKALPAEGGKDDKTIQAAAAEGAQGANGTNPEDEEELGEDGKPLAKSMNLNGEEVEVVDAGALIKSLSDLTERTTETETVLAKGMTAVIALVQGQSELIKSLQGQINKLGTQGTGRKTVLTVLEKPAVGEEALAKSQGAEPQVTKADILAKANVAFDAKKITGHEFNSIDVSLRQGVMPDQSILAKCF